MNMLTSQIFVAENMKKIVWRLITDREALIATVSILRYEKEHNKYPESLEQLVESEYIKIVPQDPFSGNSLVYKKTDDGFILYSVGLNMIDDRGVIVNNKWAKEGDAVFWPVD